MAGIKSESVAAFIPESVADFLRNQHPGPSTLLRAAPPLRPASVLSPSRLEPLAACPFTSSDVTKHRFSRSIRKPGRASRRLHAGCRSGSIRASPELIPKEGSPPGSDIVTPLSTLLQRFACARLSRPCLPKSCPGVSATLPSRPGEFHPEPLTDPGVILSHHPARATERRPPPSVEKRGLFLLPVGPFPTSVTCPLCSTGITPLRHYYGAVRP